MKKIAIFQTDLSMGGIQKSLVNLLNSIDYKKYSVDLYLFSHNNFFENDLPKELNIIYLKPLPYFTRGIFFSLLKKIKHYTFEKTYDISIDYNSYDQSCALASLNVYAKKHVMWVHNDPLMERKYDLKYRLLHFFFKSKFRFYDEFICVSKGVIDPFKKLNKITHENFRVIPNLVLADEIVKKSKEDVNITLDSSKYNLVSVGRFVIQKGFDILIDDMKKVVQERQDIHLYIIGDGKKKKRILKKIKKNSLKDYVTILGGQSNPFKYEILMDGFILESRYEGQGIAFLEAKVLGLDLIVPERLKGYIDDVPFTQDMCKTIVSLKKKSKKNYDTLKSYNDKIILNINNLFDE